MKIRADAEKMEDEVPGCRSGLAKSCPSLQRCYWEGRAKVALAIRNRICQSTGTSLGEVSHMAETEQTQSKNGMRWAVNEDPSSLIWGPKSCEYFQAWLCGWEGAMKGFRHWEHVIWLIFLLRPCGLLCKENTEGTRLETRNQLECLCSCSVEIEGLGLGQWVESIKEEWLRDIVSLLESGARKMWGLMLWRKDMEGKKEVLTMIYLFVWCFVDRSFCPSLSCSHSVPM